MTANKNGFNPVDSENETMVIKKNRIIGIEEGLEERPAKNTRFSNNLKRNIFIL